MKKIPAACLALLCFSFALRAASRYDQSVQRELVAHFRSPNLCYLLLDASTKNPVAWRWPHLARPVPPGSLVKLITALAYGESHDFKYPVFVCRGTANGCWFPPGHGKIGIRRAIADSCDAYFLQLARGVSPHALEIVMRQLGIISPPANFTPSALIGLRGKWRIPPLALARAYLALAARSGDPGVGVLLRGMALSAEAGTAQAVGRALGGRTALAKTGTAPCIHVQRAPGDGYTMVLYPALAPRWVLLVQVHGVPGSEAAVAAGAMLRAITRGR